MRQYVEKIMTTPDGRRLLQQLHNDPKTFLIHGDPYLPDRRACRPRGTDDVYVDPTFHPRIQTNQGIKYASTLRILAHELGHLAGVQDDGQGRMNNVNTWENPITAFRGVLNSCDILARKSLFA